MDDDAYDEDDKDEEDELEEYFKQLNKKKKFENPDLF